MTLDDIKARDAADITIALDMTGADWRRALWQVAADRRTLLGMLEPSAIPEHEPCCACCSEVVRLEAVRLEASESHIWLEGAATERARIAEAVNRIPPGEFVRAAVLALLGDER